jgi:hydrogenase nickel incorporation protein HypA/HybF
MSIVEALLEEVGRQLQAHPRPRLQRVRVRVGALRQVVPETLTFCYDAAVPTTPLAGSRLEIETRPAEARCRTCSLTFPVEETWFECPRCGTLGADLLQGDELELVSIDLITGG